jgi:hypothetical protein
VPILLAGLSANFAEITFAQVVYAKHFIADLHVRETTANQGRHLAQYLEHAFLLAVTE